MTQGPDAFAGCFDKLIFILLLHSHTHTHIYTCMAVRFPLLSKPPTPLLGPDSYLNREVMVTVMDLSCAGHPSPAAKPQTTPRRRAVINKYK